MSTFDAEPERLTAIRHSFDQFLDHSLRRDYRNEIKELLRLHKYRIVVDVNDLRASLPPDQGLMIMRQPSEYITTYEEVLQERCNDLDIEFSSSGKRFRIGFRGNFGSHHVTPRFLASSLIGCMVCVEGIVTKCSIVRPKVTKSVHYCEATDRYHDRNYHDSALSVGAPNANVYPTKDEHGNPLTTEFGLSTYRDTQVMTIQEIPERAPPGQLPRSVDVLLEDGIVDIVKPGDRVNVVGVYRPLNPRQSFSSRGTNSLMRTVIIANNIIHDSRILSPTLTKQDETNAHELASDPKVNVFELLAQSLAPSIYGHDYIKKALLLLLLGGVEKIFPNTHVRGDINLLLVGDPSTAKSQLLRFMMHIAPLVVSTTGRASTGVGLTAAVTQDSETGERTLQAGAMVLGDRGIVCIDEFDKMSDQDRVAIHEVMEQQTVTIAKAGVHTSLNARCSVVAAANPIYGMYDRNSTVQRNIGLPDSLLSRFDMLFIVLDERDSSRDREIAKHVLNMHMYKNPDEFGKSGVSTTILDEGDDEDEDGEDEDDQQLVVGMKQPGKTSRVFLEKHLYSNRKLVSLQFLRKYIHYAKSTIPILTEEASNEIIEAYTKLRSENVQTTLPITPRSLDTLIRLATAHAKCRLSSEVTKVDVDAVLQIMQYSIDFMNNTTAMQLQQQLQKKQKSQQQPQQQPAAAAAQQTTRTAAVATTTTTTTTTTGKRKRGVLDDMEDDSTATPDTTRQPSARPTAMPTTRSSNRTRKIVLDNDEADDAMPDRSIRELLINLVADNDTEDLAFEPIVQTVMADNSITLGRSQAVIEPLIRRSLLQLQDENKVVFDEESGIIFRV